jgi:hypothetical protein
MASDFMAKLSEKKMDLYRKTMPTTPIVPIDLYPYKIKANKREDVVWCCPQVNEFPRAIDLKVNGAAGVYDVVAVFNWEDAPASKTLSLEKDLGLQAGQDHIIFNFWEQQLNAITQETIETEIPAHGTQVFVIKPVLDHPQVIGTSRHITGAVSLKQVSWAPSSLTLKGISEIIPGAPYSLFVHVPGGLSVSEIKSDTEMMFHTLDDSRVLEVKFSGEKVTENEKTISWDIIFE